MEVSFDLLLMKICTNVNISPYNFIYLSSNLHYIHVVTSFNTIVRYINYQQQGLIVKKIINPSEPFLVQQ